MASCPYGLPLYGLLLARSRLQSGIDRTGLYTVYHHAPTLFETISQFPLPSYASFLRLSHRHSRPCGNPEIGCLCFKMRFHHTLSLTVFWFPALASAGVTFFRRKAENDENEVTHETLRMLCEIPNVVIPSARPVIPNARPIIPNARPIIPNARPIIPNARPVIPNARPVIPHCVRNLKMLHANLYPHLDFSLCMRF